MPRACLCLWCKWVVALDPFTEGREWLDEGVNIVDFHDGSLVVGPSVPEPPLISSVILG